MFSRQFINELKKNINIVDLINEYTPLTKVGMNVYKGRCPHPDHVDRNASLRVWVKEQSWACMGCHYGKKGHGNYGSDCISFIQWIENKSWAAAVRFLAEKYKIPIPTDKNQKLFDDKKRLTNVYLENLFRSKNALDYLHSRDINKNDIFKYELGFDGVKIVFPLLDRYNNVLGFTRRWINPPKGCTDKYKNSYNNAIFNKGCYLYGMNHIQEDCDEIRITEGPMDVILSSKYGAKNIVASLGTAFTEQHAQIIKATGKTPVFIMDGDTAGIKAAKRAIAILADMHIYSKLLIIPDGKDLCDLASEIKYDIEKYIESNSITYGMFLLKDISQKYCSKLSELQLHFYPKIAKILEEVPSMEEKVILKSFIEKNLGINLGG